MLAPLPRVALSGHRRRSISTPPSASSRASRSAACSSPAPHVAGLHDTSIVGRLKLRVPDLSLSYGGEPVLEGASLEVGAGQFVSLVGPSGSGKSSLLRAVIGLQKPLAGTVEPDVEPSEIGILFQDDALLPWRLRARTSRSACGFRGMDRARGAGEADDWLDAARPCRLRRPLSRAISAAASASASRSRRCWRCKPKLLLMDEPFASLDAIVRARIIQDVVAAGRARAHQRAARHPRSGRGDQRSPTSSICSRRGRAHASRRTMRCRSRGRATPCARASHPAFAPLLREALERPLARGRSDPRAEAAAE